MSDPTGRVGLLLDAITRRRGRWTTTTAMRWYRNNVPDLDGMPPARLRYVARGDLRDLAAWGHLVLHEEPGRIYFKLKN